MNSESRSQLSVHSIDSTTGLFCMAAELNEFEHTLQESNIYQGLMTYDS